jgi:hypothetical protein
MIQEELFVTCWEIGVVASSNPHARGKLSFSRPIDDAEALAMPESACELRKAHQAPNDRHDVLGHASSIPAERLKSGLDTVFSKSHRTTPSIRSS